MFLGSLRASAEQQIATEEIMVASRVYLAASSPRAVEMEGVKSVLQEVGYSVVSTWHTTAQSRAGVGDVSLEELKEVPEHCEQFALRDVGDLFNADILIMFTGDGLSTGGRHTEYGMAILAPNIKSIVIVGPRENVFQCYAKVLQFDSWHDFIFHLFNGLALQDERRGRSSALYVDDILRSKDD
jgi:hypothetical protein